jgi:hypothetical protein
MFLSFTQVSALRNEIDEKQGQIEEHRDTLQKLTLAHEQLQRDYERLKEDEQEKSKRLQELLSLNERREQVSMLLNLFYKSLMTYQNNLVFVPILTSARNRLSDGCHDTRQTDIQHNGTQLTGLLVALSIMLCHNADCRVLFVVVLNVLMLSDVAPFTVLWSYMY